MEGESSYRGCLETPWSKAAEECPSPPSAAACTCNQIPLRAATFAMRVSTFGEDVLPTVRAGPYSDCNSTSMTTVGHRLPVSS